MKNSPLHYTILCLIPIILFVITGNLVMASQPSQQYSKIFLDPFYRANLSQNINYSSTLIVNPPDGVSRVDSAIITLDVWMTPTVTINAWVNGLACRNPSYSISTTYSGAGRGVATFDCGNIIRSAGTYSITFRLSSANAGASTAWIDLTYMNNPVGDVTVHGTEYLGGDSAKVWLQLLHANGTIIPNAACYLSTYTPNGDVFFDNAVMAYTTNGIYEYDFTAPLQSGVYPNIANCYYVVTQTPYNAAQYSILAGQVTAGVLNDTTSVNDVDFRIQEVLNGTGNRRFAVEYNISALSCLNTSSSLLTGATLYWRGKWPASPNNDLVDIFIYNWTSGQWRILPNNIPDGGARYQVVTNSFFFTNLSTSGLASSTTGLVRIRFNDTAGLTDNANNNFDTDRVYFGCDQLGSPQYQNIKGSSEMHITSLYPYTQEREDVTTINITGHYEGGFRQVHRVNSFVYVPTDEAIEFPLPHDLQCDDVVLLEWDNNSNQLNWTQYPYNDSYPVWRCIGDPDSSVVFTVPLDEGRTDYVRISYYDKYERYANTAKSNTEYTYGEIDPVCRAYAADNAVTFPARPYASYTQYNDPFLQGCYNYYEDYYFMNDTLSEFLDEMVVNNVDNFVVYEEHYHRVKYYYEIMLNDGYVGSIGVVTAGMFYNGNNTGLSDSNIFFGQRANPYRNYLILSNISISTNPALGAQYIWNYSNRTLTESQSFNNTEIINNITTVIEDAANTPQSYTLDVILLIVFALLLIISVASRTFAYLSFVAIYSVIYGLFLFSTPYWWLGFIVLGIGSIYAIGAWSKL